jgi:hypothetical protein
MASSKASKRFQHLETGCPSFPQKLQVSTDFFLVLEVDSVDFEEDLPLEGLAGGFESFFCAGLEEDSLPAESFFSFPFYFGFPCED